MPKKPKFTREEVVDVAYNLLREKGEEYLTAREVGKALGTSTSPVFTFFDDMESLKKTVGKRIENYGEELFKEAELHRPVFKHIGINLIKMAKNEPNLFKYVFMRPSEKKLNYKENFFIGNLSDSSILLLQNEWNLTKEQAEKLLSEAWITTYGIAVMIANNVCDFSDDDISELLSLSFHGVKNQLINK
ncbi:MAG TPA: hypothetical protein DDW16_04835 [Clostridiales bacterium]|nr:hypothetical protein [Clostridiales bacterium]